MCMYLLLLRRAILTYTQQHTHWTLPVCHDNKKDPGLYTTQQVVFNGFIRFRTHCFKSCRLADW